MHVTNKIDKPIQSPPPYSKSGIRALRFHRTVHELNGISASGPFISLHDIRPLSLGELCAMMKCQLKQASVQFSSKEVNTSVPEAWMPSPVCPIEALPTVLLVFCKMEQGSDHYLRNKKWVGWCMHLTLQRGIGILHNGLNQTCA